jgi:hypothetical protein
MTLRPIIALAFARLRRRGPATAVSIGSIAAATTLVVVVFGIALIGADATLTRALAIDATDRPAVRVSHFSISPRDLAATKASVATALDQHGGDFLDQPVRGVLTQELRDLATPVVDLVIAVDDPADWLTLTEGRAPAPCVDGTSCEAVLLAEEPAPAGFTVAHPDADLALTIVGRGQLHATIPFGQLDQRGPFGDRRTGGDYQTGRASPAVLLVNGVDAIATSPALDRTGRTYVWASPVRAGEVHPWTAEPFGAAVDAMTRDLRDADSAFSIASPLDVVALELARADAARGRLLFVGSLGVAILLAFAVFLAQVMRDDLDRELIRLAAAGARRRQRGLLLLLETVVPTLVGGVIGWIVGGLAVGALAATAGIPVGPIVGGALLAPAPLLAMTAVLAATAIATLVASLPVRSSAVVVRSMVVVAVAVVVVLGWGALSAGPLGPDALTSALASPVVVLLPPAATFLLAFVLATSMPPLLRWASRRLRGGPLQVRLSLLSLAREPGRPAAAVTLLAFSLGAIVFAMGWSASLSRGIADGAAYRTGLDLRVQEIGTGLSISRSVVPVDRYASLGGDVVSVPVYRDASPAQPGGPVEIVGLPPAAIPTLPGWRPDFSATSADELAARLAVAEPPGGWRTGGYRIPPGDTLTLPLQYVGETLRLDAIVSTDDGDSTTVAMGSIRDGMTSVSAPLPDGAQGGRVTALIFHNDRIVAGSGHQHELFRATVTFPSLDGLVGPEPIDLEIFTVSTVIIRAPSPTDGLVIPAVVSPDLAASAAADGRLDLHVGSGLTLPLRVVGAAERFPTVMEPSPRFVVVPIDPFLAALGSVVPGSGRPSEMWVSVPDPERVPAVRAALARDPFRFAEVASAADVVASRSGDPLSQGVIWALVIAAATGLLLSVATLILVAAADLRDDRGDLADLEAQGVPPSALRWLALARTTWLAIGGSVAGILVGVTLTVLATAVLSLTADGVRPIPPLVVSFPLVPILVTVLLVVGVILGIVAWLARRTYAASTLAERRAGSARAALATVRPVRPDAEAKGG